MRANQPDKPSKQDLLLLFARGQGQKEKKRAVKGLTWALLVLAAALALIVWLSWPRPAPPPLTVIAFDQAALPDEPVRLRGQLQPEDPAGQAEGLAGFELSFADSLLETEARNDPGKHFWEKAETGPDGEAVVKRRLPLREQPYPLVVRYAGDKKHRNSSYDQARVFTWPADTPLLVVEARHGLMEATEARFRRANQFTLPVVPGAVEALRAARAKKYQIVYLAVAPRGAQEYRKLRSWLQRPGPVGALFPEGPALGREHYPGEGDEAAAQRAVLRALRERFRGKMVGVVRRGADARAFQEAGLTTLLIGGKEELPEGVKRVEAWDRLAEHLP